MKIMYEKAKKQQNHQYHNYEQSMHCKVVMTTLQCFCKMHRKQVIRTEQKNLLNCNTAHHLFYTNIQTEDELYGSE